MRTLLWHVAYTCPACNLQDICSPSEGRLGHLSTIILPAAPVPKLQFHLLRLLFARWRCWLRHVNNTVSLMPDPREVHLVLAALEVGMGVKRTTRGGTCLLLSQRESSRP
jgi:hypothetical protein